jgi:hypothetical protein
VRAEIWPNDAGRRPKGVVEICVFMLLPSVRQKRFARQNDADS